MCVPPVAIVLANRLSNTYHPSRTSPFTAKVHYVNYIGVIFEIPYTSYLVPLEPGSDICIIMLDYMPSGTSTSFMILGDVFMRDHMVVFDKENNRLGFDKYSISNK
jgi:hypothetical protein